MDKIYFYGEQKRIFGFLLDRNGERKNFNQVTQIVHYKIVSYFNISFVRVTSM